MHDKNIERFSAMRKVIGPKVLVILILATLLAASVSAQLPIPIKVYAGGGLGLQDKPTVFNDWYKSGWHMTAGVGYSVMPMVELIGAFEYHSFSSDFVKSGDAILSLATGGSIKATMFGLAAKMTPNMPMFPIKPYGLAGIGLAKVTQSDFGWPGGTEIGVLDYWETTLGVEDQTKLYYTLGGGVLYSFFPKVSLFAEARYTTIQIDDSAVAFNKPLRFWGITAGVRLL